MLGKSTIVMPKKMNPKTLYQAVLVSKKKKKKKRDKKNKKGCYNANEPNQQLWLGET